MIKVKQKSKVWQENFRPYGVYEGPKGNPQQWASSFKARFTQAEIKEIIGNESPWTILGLAPGATQAEIKKAFRLKSRETHPDLHPEMDGSAFRRVKAAFDQLTPE